MSLRCTPLPQVKKKTTGQVTMAHVSIGLYNLRINIVALDRCSFGADRVDVTQILSNGCIHSCYSHTHPTWKGRHTPLPFSPHMADSTQTQRKRTTRVRGPHGAEAAEGVYDGTLLDLSPVDAVPSHLRLTLNSPPRSFPSQSDHFLDGLDVLQDGAAVFRRLR